VHDLPETDLPPGAPPAPWATALQAVAWWHRAADAALDALPERLRGRPRLPVTVAALVRYAESPVGPYHEVLATPVILVEAPVPAGTVPFIAVDSLASIAGGRANWALPKTLARFEWSEAGRELAAHGDGWRIDARARPRGPALPFAVPLRNRQVAPDGAELVTGLRARGRLRLGRAAVRVSGPSLPPWLRDGDHPAVVVTGARLDVAAPRRARR
jgi:hypothetical protein